MSKNRRIDCEYSDKKTEELLESEYTLAVITFDGSARASDDPRVTHSGLTQLGDNADVCEVWRSPGPVSTGRCGSIGWSSNKEHMFCSVYVEDTPDIAAATEDAYKAILSLTQKRGYTHLERAWNYFAQINVGHNDNERYRQFCIGRLNAFNQAAYDQAQPNFPSACAIGRASGGINIYLIASNTECQHFENPEQVSAYHYPKQYGPASPSFARATLSGATPEQTLLHISGTAAVKGHKTLFSGNVQKQLSLTLENISQLVDHIKDASTLSTKPSLKLLKVYLRRSDDLEKIRPTVSKHFPSAKTLFIHGDICRQDLDVEIDGLCITK